MASRILSYTWAILILIGIVDPSWFFSSTYLFGVRALTISLIILFRNELAAIGKELLQRIQLSVRGPEKVEYIDRNGLSEQTAGSGIVNSRTITATVPDERRNTMSEMGSNSLHAHPESQTEFKPVDLKMHANATEVEGAAKIHWSTARMPWDAIIIVFLRIPIAAAIEATLESQTIGTTISNLLLAYAMVRLVLMLTTIRKGYLVIIQGKLEIIATDFTVVVTIDDLEAAAKGRAFDRKANKKISFGQGWVARGGEVAINGQTFKNARPADLVRRMKTLADRRD